MRIRLHIDPHPSPHMMGGLDNGGCFCLCELCVQTGANGFRRCICPRCNQDCAGVGRLGTIAPGEQMLSKGKPARRWWWSR